MLPAGYLSKVVGARPPGLDAPAHVVDIYSVCDCFSSNFADYVGHWRHNGFWLFDNPETIRDIARKERIDLAPMTLFYYEMFDQQFDDKTGTWSPFRADDFPTRVDPPDRKHLAGFDVVTFSAGGPPECSPLACNGLASSVAVNGHCLSPSFAATKSALENGMFKNAEPGPYRIFAVYTAGPEKLGLPTDDPTPGG
jgi:hypothetical protein